jgi:hypothetical protein
MSRSNQQYPTTQETNERPTRSRSRNQHSPQNQRTKNKPHAQRNLHPRNKLATQLRASDIWGASGAPDTTTPPATEITCETTPPRQITGKHPAEDRLTGHCSKKTDIGPPARSTPNPKPSRHNRRTGTPRVEPLVLVSLGALTNHRNINLRRTRTPSTPIAATSHWRRRSE